MLRDAAASIIHQRTLAYALVSRTHSLRCLADPPLILRRRLTDTPADHVEHVVHWAQAQHGLETLLRAEMIEYKQKGGTVVRARGTVASRAIAKGEVIVNAPLSIVLSAPVRSSFVALQP